MKKAFPALLCACGIILGGMGAAAQESGNYKETVYPLAKSAHESHEQHLPGAFARADGGVDYFVFPGGEQGMNPEQYHSGDGGKTWQAVPMDWYGQAKKQYQAAAKPASEQGEGIYNGGGIGSVGSIYMADNGDIYCTMQIGSKNAAHGSSSGADPVIKVLKVTGGAAKEIPNVTLGQAVEAGGEWESPEYKIAGVDGKGGIAIVAEGYDEAVNAYTGTVLTYDEATGKLKSTAACPVPKAQFYTYAGGTAYAVNFLAEGGKWELVAYDGATGKLLRSLPYPSPAFKSDGMHAVSVGARDDGTVFVTSTGGLSRLDPGSNQFVKLLDGAACRLKTDAYCNDRAACGADGTVYLPICYVKYGTSKLDDTSKTQGKLYCYGPQ